MKIWVLTLYIFFFYLVKGVKGQKPTFAKQNWKDGRVPYTIENFNDDEEESKSLKEAIQKIESRTCLRFVHKENFDQIFLKFKRDDKIGCAHVGPEDELVISKNCRNRQVFEHELLHVLGRSHEQDRTDRDEYIKWDNQKPNCPVGVGEISPVKNNDQEALDILYDYASHVSDWGECYHPILDEDINIGSGESRTISVLDFDKLNAVYNCSGQFGYRFVNVKFEHSKDNLVLGGSEPNDFPLHICRLYHKGLILIGKAKFYPDQNECFVSHNRGEHFYTKDFEVLTNPNNDNLSWVRGDRNTNFLEINAVSGGRTNKNRETLFVVRCTLNFRGGGRTIVPGYALQRERRARIGFNRDEHICDNYEVLVAN